MFNTTSWTVLLELRSFHSTYKPVIISKTGGLTYTVKISMKVLPLYTDSQWSKVLITS
jgi:hypothetical protein